MDDVIPVSAKYGHGVEDVKDWILSKLPLGPAYYPKACTTFLLPCILLFQTAADSIMQDVLFAKSISCKW